MLEEDPGEMIDNGSKHSNEQISYNIGPNS